MRAQAQYTVTVALAVLWLERLYPGHTVTEDAIRQWASRHPGRVPRKGKEGRACLYDVRDIEAEAARLWGPPP